MNYKFCHKGRPKNDPKNFFQVKIVGPVPGTPLNPPLTTRNEDIKQYLTKSLEYSKSWRLLLNESSVLKTGTRKRTCVLFTKLFT